MKRNPVNAVANFGPRFGDVLRVQSFVDRLPGLAGIVSTKCSRGRNGDEDPVGIARIEKYGVQAHATGAGLPAGSRAVAAQSGELLPVLTAIRRLEESCVFHAGVHRIRVGERRFQMPDSLELPRMRRPVVPLMRAGDTFVHELVSHRLPAQAAVVRALDHLPGPGAGLRCVQPIRINRRSFDVIHLPARKMGAADIPMLPFAVRCQDKRALARTNQYSYVTHALPF